MKIIISILIIAWSHTLHGQYGVDHAWKVAKKNKICQTDVDKVKENKVWFQNGAIVKISGKLPKKQQILGSLLIKNDLNWKLSIGERTYSELVLLKPPTKCNEPPTFKVNFVAPSTKNLVRYVEINKKSYHVISNCKLLEINNDVVFSNIVFTDKQVHHTCSYVDFYNLNTFESCSAWCNE